MTEWVRVDSKTCLGTKEVTIGVHKEGFVIDIIAFGDWHIEEVKTLKELEDLLNEYYIQKYAIVELLEKSKAVMKEKGIKAV